MHNNQATLPLIIAKEKESFKLWLALLRHIAKPERFGLGQKITDGFLNIIELTFIALYLPVGEKEAVLSRLAPKVDTLKLFLQIAWENKMIAQNKYLEISQTVNEVGKMLGGWIKNVQSKTPAA